MRSTISFLYLFNITIVSTTSRFLVPGEYCTLSTQCNSYGVLGDNACTGTCTVSAKCLPSASLFTSQPPPTTCCLGLPLGSSCTPPDLHTSKLESAATCESPLECLQTSEGNYKCEEGADGKSWKIGAVLVILSSISLNIGFNLQKFAYRALNVIPEDERPAPYRIPLWNIGFLVFLCGSIMNFAALKFAAQSLAAPLGGVSLICNAIVAPYMNNESLTRADIVAIAVILTGTVIVVLFADHEHRLYNLCELVELYKTVPTILYISILAFLLLLVLSFMWRLNRNHRRLIGHVDQFHEFTTSVRNAARNVWGRRRVMSSNLLGRRYKQALRNTRRRRSTGLSTAVVLTQGQRGYSICSDMSTTNMTITDHTPKPVRETRPALRPFVWIWRILKFAGSKIYGAVECICSPFCDFNTLTELENSASYRYLLPLSYASVGGLLGGMTVLFAKSTAELLSSIFEGDFTPFANWYFYVILAALAVTGVGQIWFVNQGLRRFDALLQMPVYYVLYTVASVVSGGIYFDEFEGLHGISMAMFVFGLFLDLFGVVCLGRRLVPDDDGHSTNTSTISPTTPTSLARILDVDEVDEDELSSKFEFPQMELEGRRDSADIPLLGEDLLPVTPESNHQSSASEARRK